MSLDATTSSSETEWDEIETREESKLQVLDNNLVFTNQIFSTSKPRPLLLVPPLETWP